MSERRYWQTVEERRSGRVDGATPEELPAGAWERPDEISRRRVLQLMGASAALAGTTACRRPVEHIVPYVQAPEAVTPGVPRMFATTVPWGTSAYGALVESHENRPTKVEGNPLHPGSHGAASLWMQASILDLYDPDRARGVAFDGSPTTWEKLSEEWGRALASDGTIAVLSEGYASPTMARLRNDLETGRPGTRWVVWDAIGDAAVFQGWGGRPVYHLDRARTVLSLDADLLHTEDNALHNARGYGKARDPERGEEMLRLYAVEAVLSVTGGCADHRLRLRASQVPAFAAAVATALGVAAPSGWGELPPSASARVAAIAEDLRRAGAGALVAAGRSQPAAVHALARALNEHLGAVGSTVTVHGLDDVGWSRPEDVADLLEALQTGTIETLVVLGGNPAATLPGLRDLLPGVPRTIYLGTHPDETARACQWHVARAHWLESWGDARAADGTRSVVQPLILPLLGGTSDVEMAGFLRAGERTPGHDLVRETWGTWAGDEAAWRRVLHDGVAPGSGTRGSAGAEPGTWRPPASEGFEVRFLPSTTWDGRGANNAWLQELPDPVTKLVWGSAALVSPATARDLGVEGGDAITLTRGDVSIALPALVLPGTADGTVGLALGYGRTDAGRVGNGVGHAVEALREPASPWIATGVTATAGGAAEGIVSPQGYSRMADRDLVREATREELHEHPELFREHGEGAEGGHAADIFQAPVSYDEGYQWGMVIDLGVCTGCMACVTACQSENNVPVVGREQVSRGREMHWIRVDRYFTGDEEEPSVAVQPVPCMHCERAPCEQVCPVAATVHDPEGLNLMVYNRCIGTRYCSNNCPYKVRRFNFFNFTKDTPELVKMAMNPDVTVRSRGVMEKCTYCIQRINRAKRTAKSEGRRVGDGDLQTACQQTCPTGAIVFGDLLGAESRVAATKESARNYVLLEELGNRPRTSYLGRVRNPNPRWEGA